MINGNVSLDELMSQLLTAHDTYTSQLTVEIREEGEREARNAVKAEQDLAFEMAQQVRTRIFRAGLQWCRQMDQMNI